MSTNENTLEATSIDIPLPSDLRYGYRSFIDELKVLEEVYYPSSMDRNLTQSIANQYGYLLARVRNYANYGKKLSENNDLTNLENKDITILNYVHSSILSRLNQLKSTDSNDLIINILGFIEIVKSNMDNLVQQKQIEKIDFYKKGYESQIEQKIAEANSFIQQLQTAIEQYYKEIDDAFKELLTETEELKAKAENDVQKLNEKKEKLEKQLPLKMLFGSLKVLTSALAFTGPQGALAGSLINSGTNIAEAFTLNDNDGKKLPLSSIPEGAESFIKKWGEYSKGKKEEIKKLAKDRMKEIDDLLKDKPKELLSPSLKEVEKRREDIETELKKLSDNEAEYDPAVLMKKCDLQQDLVNALKDEKKAHKERSEIEDQEYQKRTEWLEKAEKIANIVSAGVEIYNTYKEHEAAIDEIDEAISKNQETVEKFNKFEGKVNTFSQGTVVNMKVSVTSLEKSLSTKSHIALDVSKWQMQTNLKDIKHELDKMTAGFAAQSEFIHVFEKVSDVIATLVVIYDRIQNYQEQAQLVDYIANVSSSTVTFELLEINELKIIILQNTILERYSTLISAVKQWAFPFADRFFNDFNFMLGIDNGQSINKNTDSLKEIIKILEEKLQRYNNSIRSMDKKIVQTSFGKSDSKIPPGASH